MTATEIEEIVDAALDLPERMHAETLDVVVTAYDVASLPTGTLIVSRGSCLTILYHSNDMHCHCSILVWCAYDGTDRISMNYEPGKTRPMVFELDTYVYEIGDYVMLNEIGSIVRGNEYAYKPKSEILSHPRYLQAIGNLIRILPLTHLSNDTDYGFMHKWQPNYWRHPETAGFANVRDYYHELSGKENALASGFRERRRISSTCVDLVISFISLLHEDLYIRLTGEEIAEGKVPAGNRVLANVDDYDLSRLLRPNSEIYQLYEKEAQPFLQGVHTHPRRWDVTIFFGPVIIFSFLFFVFLLFLKPIIYVLFGGVLEVGKLPF